MVHKLGLGRTLGLILAVAQLPVIAVSPAHSNPHLCRAKHSLTSRTNGRDNVSVVCQRVHQRGTHRCLSCLLVLSHVINMPILRLDEGAIAPSHSRLGMIVRKDGSTERSHQPRRVFVRLYAVAQASIIATTPREHPRHSGLLAHSGRRLHRHNVGLPAAYIRQAYLAAILQAYSLDFTGRVHTLPSHHLHCDSTDGIAFALYKDRTPDEFGAVGVTELSSRDDVFASLAISKLAKFGGTSSVEVSSG
mmetsp:Transcript_24223/g.41460  ORF Transcript_24223/g.41460 Transcript_24223/m.41460 type:complete len:248 (-) Transcript_24223:490-1233(-)